MKKFYSLVAMSLAALASWAGTVTFDFASADGLQAMGITAPEQSKGVDLTSVGAITVDGVSLTAINGNTNTRVWNSQGSYTLRIYVDGAVTLSVAEGSITGVTLNAANENNFTISASNGNYSTSGTTGTWTGSTNSVSFYHTGSKNAQIANIVVTTSDADPSDPTTPTDDPTVDSTKVQVDSVAHIAALEDGTEFQFTNETYVNYVNGKYLYLLQMDAEGYITAALVYGETGKTYKMGDVIPAGWTAKKTTYKGLVEATNPAGFTNSVKTVDAYDYEAVYATGYLNEIIDPEQGWQNFKIMIEKATLSEADDKGNFTLTGKGESDEDVTIKGYNKWGIDYPEDVTGVFNVEAMVSINNNEYELLPINIEKFENNTHLWKLNYRGADNGTEVVLNDSLYVVYGVPAEKIIYVTDNATSILYDEYADYGFTWYEDWYPSWAVLEFDDEELYNQVAEMGAIAPNTVKGIVNDAIFNTRIAVTSVPEKLDVEYPELNIYGYNLIEDSQFFPAGNEILTIAGEYQNTENGAYLMGNAENNFAIKANFSYAPELQTVLANGNKIEGVAVAKMKENWETTSSDDNGAPRKAAPAKVKKAPLAARKSIVVKADPNAADYFNNYELYIIEIDNVTAVADVNSTKAVKSVEYINALGQTSDKAHQGFNVVKTTYTDGTTATTKVIK